MNLIQKTKKLINAARRALGHFALGYRAHRDGHKGRIKAAREGVRFASLMWADCNI
ncbi:MAG: hypothetical protein RL077_331 [Verrucomicrobiota bacterium]|jgi:hypothetical protein